MTLPFRFHLENLEICPPNVNPSPTSTLLWAFAENNRYFKCCNNTTYRISSVAHILYATYVYELLDIYHFVSSFIIPYHSNHIVLYLGLQFIWTLLHVGRLPLISGPDSCSHVLHGKYLIKTVST